MSLQTLLKARSRCKFKTRTWCLRGDPEKCRIFMLGLHSNSWPYLHTREAESIAKLLVHVRPWYGADDTDSNFDPSAETSAMMRYLQAVTYCCLDYWYQRHASVNSCLTGRSIRHSVLVHTLLACERIHGTLLRAAAFSLTDERHHE